MRYAEVAVDAPVAHGRTFSYSVPPSLDLRAGHLVEVPFGERRLPGVVFALTPQPQVPETRDILRLTYDDPVLSDVALELARWTSQYYLCSLFDAAAPMLPPGGRSRRKTYLSAVPGGTGLDSLTAYQSKVMQYIAGKGRTEQERLVDVLGQGARAVVRRLVDREMVVRSYGRGGPTIDRKYVEYASLPPGDGQTIDARLAELQGRAPRQAELFARLAADRGRLPLSEARKEYGPAAVNGLLAKELIVREAVPVDRDPLAGKAFQPGRPVTLTPAQRKATAEIRAALDAATPSHRVFLIEGVTGSGKTEVYLDAVERCLALRKRAIVLVPEIALTHQTVERFAARFPGDVAVLHSGLTDGQRFDQWWKIARGEYGVVVGSRSAIFAPQPDLGLVVIDEEHEWTYKQHDASPRYHTRDVAIRLAELRKGVVVLGSASPDVGSYRRARRGLYSLLRLPERVFERPSAPSGRLGGSKLALAEVVDMRKELREGNRHMFSRALMQALSDCVESGAQAILFLNRRGSASHLQCRSCGFTLRCRRCDVGMTYHRDEERVICHYCGERRKPPSMCPSCLSYKMALYGMGTQSVVQEVRKMFPKTEVLRWDRDTTTARGAYEQLLERFRSGAAQVLVGTQMIAKGLHFPDVTLVGVVSADVGLGIPDYRAGERAFQLLYQVAGRAGRGPSKGRVIIQTYQPDNYAIKAAALQDYPRFYGKEMAYRREQGNPPFSRLVRLVYVHTNNAKTEQEAVRRAELLRRERDSWGYADVHVLGPTPAFPSRLRGRYRWQITVRGQDPRKLLDGLDEPQGWTVDVDPVGLG